MYHSDPGANVKKNKKKNSYQVKSKTRDSDKYLGYHSEPDAKYIEIDYEFLKQLRKLAQLNLQYRSCVRRRSRESNYKKHSSSKKDGNYGNSLYEKLVDSSESNRDGRREKSNRSRSVSCHNSKDSHCDICCSLCQLQKKTNSLKKCDSISRSAASTPTKVDVNRRKNRSRSIDWCSQPSDRRGSVHSVKSVSFIQDKEPKSSTMRNFSNDLKIFQSKPVNNSNSKLSFKEKFLCSLRTSFDDKDKHRRRAPSVSSMKGLWKSF